MQNGNLKLRNKELFHQELQKYEGKECSLIIKGKKENRSDSQNRYYWGVVIEELSQYTGYDREEMHEIMKAEFLKRRKEVFGEIREYVESTTRLSTKEFSEYTEQVKKFASEQGLYIPDASEIYI